MPRFAACRVSCGLWAARNACGMGCAGAWGGMPRFAACRVSCGLWAARNACVGGVRWGVRGMPRFAACRVSCGLWAARNACGVGCWGVRGMLRFAACRVSCGLRAARNACFFVLRHRFLGRCPKPRQARREACAQWALGPKAQSDPKRGSETMSATVREARMIEQPGRPLHPALLSPYLTTRFLSLRISSVTPSGGSPNVALSVLLPPSHVSCIAISRASIRQPSSTTVTTSPTS